MDDIRDLDEKKSKAEKVVNELKLRKEQEKEGCEIR